MTRPTINTIASTGEAWDAVVDSNFKVLAGIGDALAGAMPLVRFPNVPGLPGALISEDCIAYVQGVGVYEHPGTVGPWQKVGGLALTIFETAIGTFDGQPLYVKLVKRAGSLPTGLVTVAHGISTIVRLVKMEGGVNHPTVKFSLPIVSTSGSTFLLGLQTDATNLKFDVGTGWVGGDLLSDPWVLIYYTKT